MPVRRGKKPAAAAANVSGVTSSMASMQVQQPVQTTEWVEYKDQQGRPYYFNVVTQATTWVKPDAIVVQPPPADQPSLASQTQSASQSASGPSYQLPSTSATSSQPAQQRELTLQQKLDGAGDANSNPWGAKPIGVEKNKNEKGEGFYDLSVSERITNYLRGGVSAPGALDGPMRGDPAGADPFGFGGPDPNKPGGATGFTQGEPMNDPVGGNRVLCSLKVDKGAGLRFIYARIGWWVYEVNEEPGQPDIKAKDLITGIAAPDGDGQIVSIMHKAQAEQVGVVKLNFKDGSKVEVRRGLDLPPGHMDEGGKWHPAEINPYTGEARGPVKNIPGLGVRECTKYLFVTGINKKTHWVKLREFLAQIGETERTEILRRSLGKKKSESRGEALVEMQSLEEAERCVRELQGQELDEHPLHFDFSMKKPSFTSGGYQTGQSYRKSHGRYQGGASGSGAERLLKNDREKIELHNSVASAIVDKLRSNKGILTQHWVGKHLNRVFGCGIIRKLVFMEPLDFYDSRPELILDLDTANLGANNQVQAFKVRLHPDYEGDMRSRRSEGRQVWGRDGPRDDPRGGGGGRHGGGGRRGGGGGGMDLMAAIGGPAPGGPRGMGGPGMGGPRGGPGMGRPGMGRPAPYKDYGSTVDRQGHRGGGGAPLDLE